MRWLDRKREEREFRRITAGFSASVHPDTTVDKSELSTNPQTGAVYVDDILKMMNGGAAARRQRGFTEWLRQHRLPVSLVMAGTIALGGTTIYAVARQGHPKTASAAPEQVWRADLLRQAMLDSDGRALKGTYTCAPELIAMADKLARDRLDGHAMVHYPNSNEYRAAAEIALRQHVACVPPFRTQATYRLPLQDANMVIELDGGSFTSYDVAELCSPAAQTAVKQEMANLPESVYTGKGWISNDGSPEAEHLQALLTEAAQSC